MQLFANQLLKLLKNYCYILLCYYGSLCLSGITYHNFSYNFLNYNQLIIRYLRYIKRNFLQLALLLVVWTCLGMMEVLTAQPAFFFSPPDGVIDIDQTFEVQLRATNFTEVGGLQFSLSWDHTKAEFLNISENFPTPGASFNLNNTSAGVLAGFWNDASTYSIPDTALIFTLTFKAKETGFINLDFIDDPTSTLIVYHIDDQVFEESIIYSSDGAVCIGNKTSTFVPDSDLLPVFYQNNPNPFHKNTYIPFELSNSELVTIKIFGLTGEEIYQYSNQFGEGFHRVRITSEVFPHSGTYMYQIATAATSITKKMILVR